MHNHRNHNGSTLSLIHERLNKMKLKITPTNSKKIEAELASVNGKSTAHAYTTYSEIENLAKIAEITTLEYLLKKDANGVIFTAESGKHMPNCYKGLRNTTIVSMTRSSSGWFITSISPSSQWPNQSGFQRLTLTKEQKDIAVSKFLSDFNVK